MATAIGVQAILHLHRRVRFFTTTELINALEQEQATGKQGHTASRLVHADLAILDELEYLLARCCSTCSASCTNTQA